MHDVSALSKTDAALLALGCVLILVPVYALTPVALTNASAFAISNVATAKISLCTQWRTALSARDCRHASIMP